MVVRRALGMSSLAEAEDRSLLRDSKAATDCSWSARYGGAVPWRQRKTSIASLNFELNALRYRQQVQFNEQWRYVLVLPFGVDQPSSGVQNRLKSRRQPSTQTR